MCEPWRFLLFGSFDPLIAWVFQASHRGSFSNSSVGTLRLLRATGIPDVWLNGSSDSATGNGLLCHRETNAACFRLSREEIKSSQCKSEK